MKAFIFDMDGLMFDTERVFIGAWDYAGEKMGFGKAGYMVMKTLGMNTESCNQAWRDEFGADVDLTALWNYSREYIEDYYSKYAVSVKPGLYDLLTYLKREGYRLAVASSTKRHTVERHLTSTNVRGYFDVVITGDMVEKSKPEPDIYLRAAAELGVNPEECCALEDSRNGLLSAHAAGMQVIMVPDLWQPDETVKGFILGPFESLLAVRDRLVARAMSQRTDDWGRRVVDRATAFAEHSWVASAQHVLHGTDEDGCPVDTPDETWQGSTMACGWWKPGKVNVGIPYGWGNASTIEAFDAGIREGKYAGNVPEDKKRRVSRHTVGVDCSGLLTICWELPRRISTREIPDYASEVKCVDDIRQGDIFAKVGSHVMFFVAFADAGRQEAVIIDATRSEGRVSRRKVSVPDLLVRGYRVFRKN